MKTIYLRDTDILELIRKKRLKVSIDIEDILIRIVG
jgi:hypothetical protein